MPLMDGKQIAMPPHLKLASFKDVKPGQRFYINANFELGEMIRLPVPMIGVGSHDGGVWHAISLKNGFPWMAELPDGKNCNDYQVLVEKGE